MAYRFLASLRVRLLILVLLAVIPALGLIIYTAAEQRKFTAGNIQDNALQDARLVSAQQKRLLDETRQFLETISVFSSSYLQSQSQCQSFLETLLHLNPQYTGLGIAEPDGRITCAAGGSKQETSISGLLFYQNLLQQHDFSLGSFQIDPATGKAMIGFGYPNEDSSGNLISIAFAELDITWFNRDMDQLSLPPNATITLFDNDGTVLVRYPETMGWVGETLSDSVLVKTILSKTSGTVVAPDLDGLTRLFAFTPVDPTSKDLIYVSVGLSEQDAFQAANQILVRDLIALGIVTLLALSAAWLVGELFILRHIRALLKATNELTSGNLKARTGLPDGDGELNQLARVFDNMAEALEQREGERKLEAQKSRQRNRDLEILSHQILEVQEAQSRHLARELHDEIGQALTTIKVNLQAIRRSADRLTWEAILDESISIIDRTVQQVRNLSVDLRPSVLDDLGVVAAIRSYLDRQARRAGFEAQFYADPPELRLNPALETTCFRVTQEAVTNVIRHAHAKHVRVELRQQGNFLELTIQDDGIGFDVQATHLTSADDTSLGLVGMEERVRLVGGQIEINSEPVQGQGTRVRARFPIQLTPAPGEPQADVGGGI